MNGLANEEILELLTPSRISIADQAAQLFDFLVDHSEGVTWEDTKKEFRWAKDRPHFFHVVRRLRQILGDDDQINVVCDPRGHRETWLYRLVGDPEEALPWQANRLKDLEARLETIAAVAASVARNVDKRTIVGRKASKIESTVGYLLHELGDLNEREAQLALVSE